MIFSIIVYILYLLRVYYELEMGPENCAGIAEFMGSNPVQAWLCFLQALISQLLVCATGMINHKFIFFSAVQIYDLSFIHLLKKNSVNLSKLSLFFFLKCLALFGIFTRYIHTNINICHWSICKHVSILVRKNRKQFTLLKNNNKQKSLACYWMRLVPLFEDVASTKATRW